MFKKKDVVNKSSSHDEIATRLVKKGALAKDYTSYEGFPSRPPSQQSVTSNKNNTRGVNENTISDRDVTESYITTGSTTNKNQRQSDNNTPNPTKGNRKKFAPSFFLSRKKKNQPENRIYENVEDFPEYPDDITEIANYDDLVAEQQAINPVILGQLDDSQLNKIEEEACDDEAYKARVEFIVNNYRKPPPYPGKTNDTGKSNNNKAPTNHLKNDIDTPLIRQLLNDQQLTPNENKQLSSNDNASMNNYWQLTPPHHTNAQNKQPMEMKASDKLVDRTNSVLKKSPELPNSVQMLDGVGMLNAGELYEKRRQYYIETLSNIEEPFQDTVGIGMDYRQQDSLSEIFPERDYDDVAVGVANDGGGGCLSASVPDLSHRPSNVRDRTKYLQQRAHLEPGELEALIAHYRKTSLDTFEPYNRDSSASESVSLYSEGSYVPPSPYLNAEIPEWLQIYAKASSDLDKYLKWEMFRYSELDCWQTMMKRIYKKELEQVVLWFEEYRHKLQEEMNNRCIMMRL